MADRTQLRVADNNDIADDDPFAELTRIMGFDPRQPVKPAEKAAPANQAAEEGDFDIDLEKELMGEFGDDDAVVAPAEAVVAPSQAEEPAFETAATDALDDELVASLDQDFVFDDPADHFAVEETQAPQFEAAVDDGFDAGDFDASDLDASDLDTGDFDKAMASSLANVSPLEDDLPMDAELAASLDGEFQFDDQAVGAVEEPTAEPAAPAVEAAFDDGFDNAVSLSLEDELTLDDHPVAQEPVQAVADEVAPVQAVAAHSEEDFAGHFDQAMADVDMDFAHAEEPVAIDEPQAVETPAEAAYIADADDHLPELDEQAFGDDFDLSIDAPAEVEPPVAEVTSVAPASVAPAVVVEPTRSAPAADERSLEDELNALLGAMTARPVPVAPIARDPEPVRQPQAPQAAAAVPANSAEDLDWDLDEHALVEPQHVAAQPAEPDFGNLLAGELEGHDFADEKAAAPADIDFDDDAFDAAFAKGIDLGHDESGSNHETIAQPASGPDWLRSTPPEPARSWSRVTPVAASAQASFAPPPVASALPAAAVPVSVAPAYQHEPVAYAEPEPAQHEQPQGYDEMPDVETVDVPERVVALADDLDIPELNFEDDQPAASAYDDLDAEFAGLLSEMNAVEPAPAPARSTAYEDDTYSSGFKPGQDHGDARAYAAKPAETPAAPASRATAASSFDIDDLPGSRPVAPTDDFAVDELDYDPELDEAMAVPGLGEREAARQPRSRGMLVAAIVGAVAVAGGLGAFALSLGGKGGSEAPVIVKADNAPIKVKPENPGGTVVPNQDNKVYDAVVKGTKPAEPVQEKLVTNTEEPVDVKAKEPESRVVDLTPDKTDAASGTDTAGNAPASAMPGVDLSGNADDAVPAPKSEDRIAQVLQDADKGTNPEVVAVAPRKVRTMMVKPDGSLVPREDPAPAAPQVAATEPADPAPQHVAPSGQADAEQTGTVTPATDQATSDQASVQSGDEQAETAKPVKPKAEAKAVHTQSSDTPATVPLAPQRPSDQPVDVVGEVKPDQVASISPTAAAAGGGSWSMQIASQPTVESAQSTYQDLQRRYGSVLSGRTANIVKAEIAGKGTFYRVRVPAQSRNDAINLCTSYKAAGGNCFVSR